MSCEYTPPPANSHQGTHQAAQPMPHQPARVAPHRPADGQPWLSAEEVEAIEHAELDAEGRLLLAWLVCGLGLVALVGFCLGFVVAALGGAR